MAGATLVEELSRELSASGSGGREQVPRQGEAALGDVAHGAHLGEGYPAPAGR
jgi:hypothetical protein